MGQRTATCMTNRESGLQGSEHAPPTASAWSTSFHEHSLAWLRSQQNRGQSLQEIVAGADCQLRQELTPCADMLIAVLVSALASVRTLTEGSSLRSQISFWTGQAQGIELENDRKFAESFRRDATARLVTSVIPHRSPMAPAWMMPARYFRTVNGSPRSLEVLTAQDEIVRLSEATVKHAHGALSCRAKADASVAEYS